MSLSLPKSAAPSTHSLQSQLQIVNKAIDIASKDVQDAERRRTKLRSAQTSISVGASLLRSGSAFQLTDFIVDGDDSFVIRTTGTQPVTCPDCLAEVDAKNFKTHQSRQCPNKIVTCPNIGCGHRLHLQSLRWHLQEECVFAVQRKQLMEQAALRGLHKQQEEEARREELRQLHRAEKQLMSTAKANAELSLLSHTGAMTESAANDTHMVICPLCGEAVRESQLAVHRSELCRCRGVLCPNFGCGCRERDIPLNRIREHLREDCRAEKMKDRLVERCVERLESVMCSTCGEQVQLRALRKHNREDCPNRLVHCRNHHLGCPAMIPLRERHLHERIDENFERFALRFGGHGAHLLIDESDVLEPWTAEFWIYRPLPQESLRVHIRNLLLQIGSYEIAYSAEMHIHQRVISVVRRLKQETSRTKERKDELKQLSKAERAMRQSVLMQSQVAMVNELTALIRVYSDAVLAYLKAFQALAIAVEAGLACVRDAHQMKHLPQIGNDELFTLETAISGDVAKFKSNDPSYMQSRGPSAPTAENGDVMDSRTSSPAIESKGDNVPAAEAFSFPPGDSDKQSPKQERESITPPSTAAMNAMGSVSLIPGEMSKALSVGKSFVTKVFLYSWTVVHTEDDAQLLFARENDDFLEQEQAKKESLVRELGETIEFALLPTLPLAKFLCEWLDRPSSALRNHAMSLQSWKDLLTLFALALKNDFDRLHDCRIEAGLLTPDTNANNEKASEPSQSFDEKRASVLKKKEKEKRRREMKRAKNQQEALKDDAQDNEQNAGDSRPVSPEGSSRRAKEIKLITRVTELFKSGSGAEIIHESSEANRDGHRSHICLSMHSGLSILKIDKPITVESILTGTQDTGSEEKDHHYELLLPEKEFKRLLNMNGNLGFVCAAREDGSHVTEVLGNQACSLSAKVPRGKWTHISFVVSKSPQNRVNCYMDGVYIGSFRDAAFPLPMLSVGGTPYSLHSFCGAMLDVRYWSHLRSSQQVTDCMHSLVEVDEPGALSIAREKQQLNGESALVNRGLIAWWTFDDGPPHRMVTDVTRNRFKTPAASTLRFSLASDTGLRSRFAIPFTVLSELPVDLLALLPAEENPLHMGVHSLLEEEEDRPITGDSEVSEGETREKVRRLSSMIDRCQRLCAQSKWLTGESIPVFTAPLSAEDEAISAVMAQAKEKEKNAKKAQSSGKSSISPLKAKDEKVKNESPSNKRPKLPYYLEEEKQFSKRGGLLPVPSFREQHLCAFELRRHRLAKSGRELQKLQTCPLGCSQQLRAIHMRFHIRFECPMRLVSCRFDCCGAIFPFKEREKHESEDCVLALQRLKILEQTTSLNSVVNCSLCSQPVRIRDLENHKLKTCPFRLLFCPRPGCSLSKRTQDDKPRIPAHLLEPHLELECDSPVVERRFLLIERSRMRHPYARPWGIRLALRRRKKVVGPASVADSKSTVFNDSDDEFELDEETTSPKTVASFPKENENN